MERVIVVALVAMYSLFVIWEINSQSKKIERLTVQIEIALDQLYPEGICEDEVK